MGMNVQKEKFAEFCAKGFSNTQAAIRAGYSEKTASVTGSRLSRDVDVQKKIEQLKKRAEKKQQKLAETGKEPEEYVPALLGEEVGKTAVINGTEVHLNGKTYSLLDPKDTLTLHMMGVIELDKGQQESAKALLPFYHGKVADMGKKGAEQQAASNALGGKFKPMAPPTSKNKKGSLIQ